MITIDVRGIQLNKSFEQLNLGFIPKTIKEQIDNGVHQVVFKDWEDHYKIFEGTFEVEFTLSTGDAYCVIRIKDTTSKLICIEIRHGKTGF